MEHGDIGNGPASPLVYIVWEGLIAVPREKCTPQRFRRRIRLHRHQAALELYETNPFAQQALLDLWMTDTRVGVVTYLGDRFALPLRERLDGESIPFDLLITTTLPDMARRVGLEKDVPFIFDSNPNRILTYGSKARFLDPGNIQLIGRTL